MNKYLIRIVFMRLLGTSVFAFIVGGMTISMVGMDQPSRPGIEAISENPSL